MANKPTVSNVPSPTPTPDLFTPPQNLPQNSTPAAIVSKTPTTSTKRSKKDMSNGANSLLMASIQRNLNTPQPQAQESGEKDPDILFCLSLVQDFKALPAKKKRAARVKMVQVLCEMHGDDDDI